MKIGDKVRHKTMRRLIPCAGTIIAVEPEIKGAFASEPGVSIPARYKVRWDDEALGESGWVRERDLEEGR